MSDSPCPFEVNGELCSPSRCFAMLLAIGLSGCNFSDGLQGCQESGRCPDNILPESTYGISGFVSGRPLDSLAELHLPGYRDGCGWCGALGLTGDLHRQV